MNVASTNLARALAVTLPPASVVSARVANICEALSRELCSAKVMGVAAIDAFLTQTAGTFLTPPDQATAPAFVKALGDVEFAAMWALSSGRAHLVVVSYLPSGGLISHTISCPNGVGERHRDV